MKVKGRFLIFSAAFCMAIAAVFLFAGRIMAEPAAGFVPNVKTATIFIAGDILMHKGLNDAAVDDKGKYDYNPLFAYAAPFVKSADYSICNLETTLSGEKAKYTGYPSFNTPDSLAIALKNAGFDMLATANNHCMDRGINGLVRTQNVIDLVGMDHVGTSRNQKECDKIMIREIKGIKIAILNYTAMTNWGKPAKKYKYAVNYIGDGKEIISNAIKAKKIGADIVIAYLHFGNEYERSPAAKERKLVEKLLAGGVDTIIGAHPHVVQPIEWMKVKRGKKDYTGLVAWSLGNFVSMQRPRYRDSGIAVNLIIQKNDTSTSITEVKYLPVWVQQDISDKIPKFRLLPLPANGKPESDLALTPADLARIDEVKSEIAAHVDDPNENISSVSADDLMAGR